MPTSKMSAAVRPDKFASFRGEFLRFLGVGVFSYGLSIALAAFFHEISGLHQTVAVALALVIVLATNFALARRFIFRSNGSVPNQFARFALTAATMRGVEYLAFLAMLSAFGMNYLLSLTFAMAISSCLKFILYKVFVFAQPGTLR